MNKTIKKIRGEVANIAGGRRRKEVLSDALDYAEKHPETLVFIADKRTDDIIAVYGSRYSAVRIRTKRLKRFIGVIDTMLFEPDKIKRQHRLSEFLGVVDAFIWNLSEKLIAEKEKKIINKKVEKEKKKLVKALKEYAKKKDSPEKGGESSGGGSSSGSGGSRRGGSSEGGDKR